MIASGQVNEDMMACCCCLDILVITMQSLFVPLQRSHLGMMLTKLESAAVVSMRSYIGLHRTSRLVRL